MNNTLKVKSDPGIFRPMLIAFSVSASVLLLQLVQTRIYSVVFWNHFVYFIISIALLGFGISGTWLSLGLDTRLSRVLSLKSAALLFVVTTVFSSLVLPSLGWFSAFYLFVSLPQTLKLLLTYVLAVFPYFFAGWILGIVFRDNARNMHALYFADLIGAGLGCLAFLVGMQPLGAVNLTLIAAAVLAAPVFLESSASRKSWAVCTVIMASLGCLAFFSGGIGRAITPEPGKALKYIYHNLPESSHTTEFLEWNTISRIDVVNCTEDYPGKKVVFIDGDALTKMIVNPTLPAPPFDPEREAMPGNATPYLFVKQPERVLVIGVGGGIDVFTALRGGAKHVDAVEINPTTSRLLRKDYLDATNHLIEQPGVTPWREEGRSFVRRSSSQYDVVMINAIDTIAALSAGAYVLSENYLYTVDAIKDYLVHLTNDGVLCITRQGPVPERARLFVMCIEALSQLGIANPENNVLMSYHNDTGSTIVRKQPFSDEERATLVKNVTTHGNAMYYPAAAIQGDTYEADIMRSYVEHRRNGQEKSFLDSLPVDIRPVTDDSPFFFHFDRPGELLGVFSDRASGQFLRGHWPSFTLVTLLAFTAVMVAAFMFLPLCARKAPPVESFFAWLVYFACLGVSFIFVEIALMQRFALLLGHPSRSLALVLAALLVFAGIGSGLQGKFRLPLALCLGLLVTTILAAAFLYPKIITSALGASLTVRGVVAIALVAPLGLFMGMPFPSGIRRVSQYGSQAVPWMWAVNGGTTVLGSVLAIVLAIWFSFTTVLVVAACGYLLAMLLSVPLIPSSDA